MTAWRPWKRPESHRTALVASKPASDDHLGTPDRLRAPHGPDVWFASAANPDVTVARDSEAEAVAAADAMRGLTRPAVAWCGRVAT